MWTTVIFRSIRDSTNTLQALLELNLNVTVQTAILNLCDAFDKYEVDGNAIRYSALELQIADESSVLELEANIEDSKKGLSWLGDLMHSRWLDQPVGGAFYKQELHLFCKATIR